MIDKIQITTDKPNAEIHDGEPVELLCRSKHTSDAMSLKWSWVPEGQDTSHPQDINDKSSVPRKICVARIIVSFKRCSMYALESTIRTGLD